MDKKLIGGAIALLFIQTLLLLADFGQLPGWSWREADRNSKPHIGVVVEKKQDLKRREQGSIVWEDSDPSDNLRAYDSVLTLEDSSARIHLQGDIKIDLHENTLIVLEPPEAAGAKDTLRIRFSEGRLLSQNQAQKFTVGTGHFQLVAQPGTNLSLKSLEDDQVEVHVATGAVQVTGQDKTTPLQTLSGGTRFTLTENKISEVQTIDPELTWTQKSEERLYTHQVPVPWLLRWTGAADKIRHVTPHNQIEWLKPDPHTQNHSLDLGWGTHAFSLRQTDGNTNKISAEVLTRILPAPKIRYTTPLARDRYTAGDKILLSWLPLEGASRYVVELTARPEIRGPANQNETLRKTFPAATTSLLIDPQLTGEIFLRVYGIDSDGFKIPPHYDLPFYILQDPLAPPKLLPPTPTPSPADKSAWLKNIWQILVPTAQAEEPQRPSPQIILSWYPVTGADFYNLEVSSDPEFAKPEVMIKVTKETYAWAGFDKKVYYWRVAAGAHSGRMGLFSETAKIDLTNLAQLKSGEIAPGVRLEKSAPPPEVALKTNSAPAPVPAPVTPNPAPATPAVVPLTTVEPPPPAPTPAHWQFGAQADLRHVSFSQEKEFSAALNGFTDVAAQLNIHRIDSENIWQLQLYFEQISWEVEDQQKWPFQETHVSNHYRVELFKKSPDKDLFWGVSVNNLTLLSRQDLEALKFQDATLYGPIVGYDFIIARDLYFTTRGGPVMGDGLGGAQARNELNYLSYKTENTQLYLGGDFDFQLFFGSESLSGYQLSTGLHLRFDW